MYWNSMSVHHSLCSMKVNSNIRCIEIGIWWIGGEDVPMVNSNIRCIEIAAHCGYGSNTPGK